jgi:outer membrane receptor protein involved in Fe transport
VPSFNSPAPGAVRYFLATLAALLVLASVRVGVAQPTAVASGAPPTAAASMGKLELELLGPMDAPVPGTRAEVDGQSAELNAEGRAVLDVPAGTHTVLFRVPRAGLPAAPTTEPEWRVSVPDVPVEANVPTTVRVGLSESGGFIRMDVSSPEPVTPPQHMQEAHAKAAEENGVGRVRGSVLAAADDSAVEEARVYVRGAPVETVTNARGEFTLSLPAGTYQLWVIHPDFATQAITKVEVKAGSSVDAQAKLNPRAPGDEYLITAPHIEGGIASMIAARRETTAVADVIGSEQMSRAGASSAAAALLRVTGLTIVDGKFVIVRGMGERYSSLLVNRLQVPSPDPARRVVPLDLFPAGILESVTVQKSYSPDMPGEFGGGVVQVTTKSYPEKFTLNTSLATGGNFKSVFLNRRTSEGGSWDWAGVDDGTRALPDAFDDERGKIRLAGARGGGYSRDEIENFGRLLPNNYATSKQRTPPDIVASLSVGNKYRLRHADIGYVAAVGYKNEYLTIRDMVQRRLRTVTAGSGDSPIQDDARLDRYNRQVSLNGFLDWGVEFSKAHKLKFTSMLLRQTDDDTFYRTAVNDEQVRSRTTRLNWVERQVVSQQLGGSHSFSKLGDFRVDWRYAYAKARRDEPDRRDYQYLSGGLDQPFELGQNGNERLFAKGNDESHEAQIDLTQPIKLWSALTGKIRAGGLVYDRARDSRVRRFSYNTSAAAFTLPLALPIEQLLSPTGPAPSVFAETTFVNDSYDATMRIYAGYAMVEAPVHKKVDLMAGARLEQALLKVSTFDLFANGEPRTARLPNLDVLPAATLTYRFIKDFQARAGYSRTLNRPDFRELSDSVYYDIEANAEIQGYPDLKRAQIDNVDARLEWYYTTDEVFSIGGFAKFFNDPIESVQVNGSSGALFSFRNADTAASYGLEVEGRKRFDFVSKKLDALFLASNLTLITSTVEVPRTGGEGTRSRPMASQSPYVLNIQLGWDDSAEGGTGTAASFLYNVYGKRLRTVAADNLGLPDIYEQPFHSLDFVASQTLKRGFKLGMRVRNILNSRSRWTQGDVNVRDFRRGADGQINVSWSY